MTETIDNPHWGSTLEDFLDEEDIREEATTAAMIANGKHPAHDLICDSTPVPADVSRLMRQIGKWTEKISTPEFKAFKRKHLSYVLADEFENHKEIIEPVSEFIFDKTTENQHKLIMAFLYFYDSSQRFSHCEYYFRRYPFRGLPMTRDDHARNMCEFYISNVYVVKERLKRLLNLITKNYPNHGIDVKSTLKQFDAVFDQELHSRHKAIHVSPFDELGIERLSLTRTMSEHPSLVGKGWDAEYRREYRRFVKIWAARAKRQALVVEGLVASVASALLQKAEFLTD